MYFETCSNGKTVICGIYGEQ